MGDTHTHTKKNDSGFSFSRFLHLQQRLRLISSFRLVLSDFRSHAGRIGLVGCLCEYSCVFFVCWLVCSPSSWQVQRRFYWGGSSCCLGGCVWVVFFVQSASSSRSELGKLLGTLLRRRNPQGFLFVVVKVTRIARSFTFGYERRLHLKSPVFQKTNKNRHGLVSSSASRHETAAQHPPPEAQQGSTTRGQRGSSERSDGRTDETRDERWRTS